MIEHLYEDLSVHLYEGEPITKKTPTPPPITYLTQWRMMGNSVVHTDEYLTQWKVEGNSVVDNNTILSCGDLGQDGKYHVKISNGVTIYDIPLTEPLRKVNDVADSIEFVNGVATVTRRLYYNKMSNVSWSSLLRQDYGKYVYVCRTLTNVIEAGYNGAKTNILCSLYDASIPTLVFACASEGICINSGATLIVYDEDYSGENDYQDFLAHIQDAEFICNLATPITETIQVSPFPVSPTDTYTSANDTPYSAFEYKKNVEIWSCGEYSAVDGKYHILVQPLGGSIADIALDEPLRKWDNDYIDSIDYSNGVATLTRKVGKTTVVPDNITLGTYGAYDVAPIPSDILYETSSYIRTKNNLYEDVSNDNRGTSINPPPRMYLSNAIQVRGTTVQQQGGSVDDYIQKLKDFYNNGGTLDILYKLATPITEVIQVPQIQEADSYTCEIRQGGKAVEWSSFETND